MYPASSSFRAWTLKLPSDNAEELFQFVECQRSVYSQRADDRQPRAFVNQPVEIRRSAGFFGGATGADASAFLRRARKAPDLAAIFPRDHRSEKNVKAAEARGQEVHLPKPDGQKSATAPSTMKQRPMSGTMRIENAPPVTTPVPYSNSQTPATASINPMRTNSSVRRPPTKRGGAKL